MSLSLQSDAKVAAAVRKAALMLTEAGAIVDESARPAFSFEEAWEVFAVHAHALFAGLPDAARDKLAACEHDFLTGVQIIAASFEDRTAIARAAILEALGVCFKAPPMASP